MDTAENHCPVVIYSTDIHAYVLDKCRQNNTLSRECEQLLQLHPQENSASHMQNYEIIRKCTNKNTEIAFVTLKPIILKALDLSQSMCLSNAFLLTEVQFSHESA